MDLYDCIYKRRDTRHFTEAEVPEAVLLKALDAAHAAPSVGLSEPWRFVVVQSTARKKEIKALFNASNEQAKLGITDKNQSTLYNTFKLEAIEETPLGIAIFCDSSTLDNFTIGTIGNTSTLEWSCACAVQNLWLSLTEQGFGAGWVSILDYSKFEKLFDVPKAWKSLGYMCIGKPATDYGRQPMLQKEKWKSRSKKPYVEYV
ncbi:5,6-dimethylbenzimidazole synthase [Pseudotamlana carrageenivorans]|uniref:5,6-dimethylbenzimidazole synthase n=1 Tax=Pseudotamlana carrageenivorans TaxID=2069432 RepID=A0A2I7SJS8_9FLAO|nr:5,6-dimethylbenzimidazole synthase [Tamlana carrageenivorans]AUS06137.1 5,6-dimethylbenzimidazole synthase [Tamlana carrageenivorans]